MRIFTPVEIQVEVYGIMHCVKNNTKNGDDPQPWTLDPNAFSLHSEASTFSCLVKMTTSPCFFLFFKKGSLFQL